MLEFLPNRILDAIKHINFNLLYEIRLRAEKPCMVNYNGCFLYLCSFGVSKRYEKALIISISEISDIVYSAGKFSVYSVEEQLKRGFITAEHGERLGLAGEYVMEKGQIITIRNFTSICIRIPHEIEDCGKEIYEKCLLDKVRNLLIMSSPGIGKTTILRDLSKKLSENTKQNILICDERGEISALPFGNTCDILSYGDKASAFESGIRALRPDIMITDELTIKDCPAILKAIEGGVKVIASAHISSIEYVKAPFKGLFERYVLLSEKEIGKVKEIYDENLIPI